MILYICSNGSRAGNAKNIIYITEKLKEIYPDIVCLPFDDINEVNKEQVTKIMFNGGDGIFHQIINFFKDHLDHIIFGYIPTGTANDMGKALGIKSIDEAFNIIKENKIKEENVLAINNQIAIYAISVGEMSRVSIDAKRKNKKLFGKLIYKINGIKYLFTKKKEIIVDGKKCKLKVLIVFRSLYLGGVRVGKGIDDKIHVYLIKNFFDVVNLFIFNRFHKIKGIEVDSITLESDSIWCVDGEKADFTKAIIKKSDKKIKLLSKNA